ncbi:MAG: exonuclease SbcCD subunit D C-terminal domain-containing protein [Candidatus Rifleibacteriota bacterium]
MKIIHTSDWHLGRTLYNCRRYAEFEAFLDWLADYIMNENADALLVAGDIFDTTTPSNKAQELYYRFLCRIAGSNCRNIVITGGNHDSPSFLEAPDELLRVMNIHVIGSARQNLEEEIIELNGKDGRTEALVCAVPYLRDRDLRNAVAGESIEDKDKKMIEGLRVHYHNVCELAEQKRMQLGDIPLIAMGHLFAAGGKTLEGDGVRELYVGTLAQVDQHTFPETIDYLALGHLHIAQKVGGSEKLRYSGSPLPMGFNEANQQKKIIEVNFAKKEPLISEIAVPCFQKLIKISGNLDEIESRLHELKQEKTNAWLEIEYTGAELVSGLNEKLQKMVTDSELEIRRTRNRQLVEKVLKKTGAEDSLENLNVYEVFERCLHAHEIVAEQADQLRTAYKEIVKNLEEEDINAE